MRPIHLLALLPFLGFLGDTNIGIVVLLVNVVVLVVGLATRGATVASGERGREQSA